MMKIIIEQLCPVAKHNNLHMSKKIKVIFLMSVLFIIDACGTDDDLDLKKIRLECKCVDENSLALSITNCISDTIYVFDTYLYDPLIKENITEAGILHQVDTIQRTHIISFLPIIKYLHFGICDVLRFDPDSRFYDVRYHFSPIPPDHNEIFKIPISALNINNYTACENGNSFNQILIYIAVYNKNIISKISQILNSHGPIDNVIYELFLTMHVVELNLPYDNCH